MRTYVLRLFILGFIAAIFNACAREDGPQWAYQCEAEDGVVAPTECHIQLSHKNHILRIVQRNGIWGMQAASGKGGHVSAELTITPRRGEPVVVTAERKAGRCSSRRCTLVLNDEQLSALLKAKQFELTVNRAEIRPHNVSHLKTNETFPTRGLKDAIKAAGV